MTEEEARSWISDRYGVSRETVLERLAEAVAIENRSQNLIAGSTVDSMWSRHIVDSAQLLPLAPDRGIWVDVGSGAGFPGMVVAALSGRKVTLIEPRRRRAEFLATLAEKLDLPNVTIIQSSVEKAPAPARVAAISARAVASLDALFTKAAHLADADTLWLLPKGRSAKSELDAARQAWQGSFHVEQSITDAQSRIIVARKVRPR
ncbi:16S rRNA (guanine(527)-N(7))-methyltransferase RsmG [Stakelama saccharophila]|uniref:Ribosomal RNA small subunit methyltransferase G n=1 Tax=Stakelama saccharophila TaxID=3075605 RepID=A0ABZ0BBF8_9SPHN|nr:16S rRNA (guanine(527)-N(7))-methyltransferase RsmG [Stakelama sp. W311]WNO54011.1 16S rRNA (guanine(527)-N(7))-methyltransferase RsmG [Stakelama sp. W311]